ncbi:MAG: hypothetical protein CL881_08985 [Dehalococcoidia bacterium]|jgi:hypothetical protein|nr:hypothetical protein [Dehalococcoidia bacterium]|tara:strand:- start:25886 stop:26143 length:258 start_codon:yes stop_codon:yes gene_type:complete
MGIGILRLAKMSTIIGKRFLYIGKKHGNKTISARVSPYIVEIINNPVMTYDHIQQICNMMVETELLAGVIRIVSVIVSLQKFIPK